MPQDDGRGANDTTRTARPSGSDQTEPAPSPSAPPPLESRDRERYEIRAEQGRGGLGLVWRAYDRELGRDVAVKELLVRGKTSELRFVREALITSRLEHPGIVPVHEAGRWSDGTPFYTMKLVGGRSLHDRIAEQRTLEGRLALLPNLVSVADAIAYAHERGVVHRDLKPSNVMVGDFGETIVIDWGLAKVLADATEQQDDFPYPTSASRELTAAGSVLGTPAYMAPEQYQGRSDERTDVYALGGILHHVLTGKPPHERTASLGFSAPSLNYARNTPEDLTAIVKRALAEDSARRYRTARAFGEDLKRYMRRERVEARRYSLASRLALAFARHRTVALVLMVALALLTITFGVALVNVRRQRAEAVAAGNRAVINSAAAMLERDPSRATETLRSLDGIEAPALLRARIQAAGIVDRRIPLAVTPNSQKALSSGDRVVLCTQERTLEVLDAKTGALTQLADNLTNPPGWDATDDRAYFVSNTSPLVVESVPIAGGPIVELAQLDGFPTDMVATSAGVFWLTATGAVMFAAIGQAPHLVAEDVAGIKAFGNSIVVCNKHGKLQMGPYDQQRSDVGTCEPAGSSNVASPDGFAWASPGALYLYTRGQLATVHTTAAEMMYALALTDTGLVAGFGENDKALIYRSGTQAVEHVALAEPSHVVAAFGNLAAWAFSDGSVEVVDAVDGRHWTIHATVGDVTCLLVLSGQRLMTCDRNEVRVWTLPKDAPVVIDDVASATHVAFDAAGNAIFDTAYGHGYEIKAGERSATKLHAHTQNGVAVQATGVAWCDAEACTSGWDGHVICTDPAKGATRVAADLHSVSPGLASGNGHCFAAAASGDIYDLRSPAKPVYTHSREPYRLAMSDDGRYEASGDWGGDIIVYDTELRRVVATSHPAHAGRVTALTWVGHRLVSSGADGMLRIWSPELREERSWHMPSVVRHLRGAHDTIAVGLDDGTLVRLSATQSREQRVALGVRIWAVATSPDGTYVGTATNDGEVIVLSADGRTAAMRLGKGFIACLEFDTATTMVACTGQGLMHIPLSAMSFQTDSGEAR